MVDVGEATSLCDVATWEGVPVCIFFVECIATLAAVVRVEMDLLLEEILCKYKSNAYYVCMRVFKNGEYVSGEGRVKRSNILCT